MSRKSRDLDQSRRSFLRNVAIAGGVAAATGTAAAGASGTAVAETVAEVQPKGYRVTPHVSKYYDKARF
ncbi:MAG: hypothetical protein AMJ58_07180 [Gammaproteobacteria bacterium SG8_30]|jgi:nitrous oxide reductase|nr:MAG: hypothetical protein AMJ58_07180 [Gammaproteobacteria bacterium SG8_30]